MNKLNKITKIQGQKSLLASESKLVLTAGIALDKAIDIFNRTSEIDYDLQTKDCVRRIGYKYNNNEVVFRILEGDKIGSSSWLSSLTGSKWYSYSKYGKDFIIVTQGDGEYNSTMVYELLK